MGLSFARLGHERMLKLKVVRNQRVSRIYCRVWLRLDLDESFKFLPNFPQLLDISFSNETRTYLISRYESTERDGTLIAVDVVIHDVLARYGVTGLKRSDSHSIDIAESNNWYGPSEKQPFGGQFCSTSICDLRDIKQEKVNLISSDFVTPGPGAIWASEAIPGDPVNASIRDFEGFHKLCGSDRVVLVLDSSSLPLAEVLSQPALLTALGGPSYFKSDALKVICQIPHKADRRDLGDVEVSWVRPPADPLMGVREALAELPVAAGTRVFVAGSEQLVEFVRSSCADLPLFSEGDALLKGEVFWR